MRTAILIGLLCCLAGCGESSDAGTPAGWVGVADDAFAEGDRLAQDERPLPGAVRAWRRAGADYMKAFRLEDPVAERAEARALLAFRIGRSWSKAARFTADAAARGPHAERALFWFAHARRLRPELRQTLYERAVLFDSDIEDVRDPARARESYQAYLDTFEDVERAGAAEVERLDSARRRLEELSAPR